MGVLGSALISPVEVLGEITGVIGDEADYFYNHAHKIIYAALRSMADKQTAIDPVTLMQFLKDSNQLDEVGGPIYVTNLFTSVPTAGNWAHYLGIVRAKYLLRRLIATGADMVTRCFEEQADVDQVLDDTEKAVFAICDRGVSDESESIKQLIPVVFTEMETLYNNRGGITGTATGFRDYDRLTSGLHPGEMTILAARPGVGKTAFALNMADHIAVERKQPVGIFSLEMSSQSLVKRMLCARAAVDSHKMRTGFLGKGDFAPLSEAAGALTQSSIHIDDPSTLTILQLRAKARRLKARHGVAVLIVDYLQLVNDPTVRGEDGRQAEVASVSRQLKALAKELSIPVVVLCQLNRDIEKRGEGATPRLADLRESGSIEQDADVVAFLTRKEADKQSPAEGGPPVATEATLILAKQRNGPTGEVTLVYQGRYTRFYNASVGTEEG